MAMIVFVVVFIVVVVVVDELFVAAQSVTEVL